MKRADACDRNANTLQPFGRRGFNRLLLVVGKRINVECLAGLEADPRQTVDRRRVVEMRRVELHRLGKDREELCRLHLEDLIDRCAHVERRIVFARRRNVVRIPIGRERRCRDPGLKGSDGGIIFNTICLRATDDPARCGRRAICLDVRRQFALPIRTDDGDHLLVRAGRARADGGEDMAPHIHDRQDIVATAGIRDGDDERFLADVEPERGIERVGIGPHHGVETVVGKMRQMRKAVHRREERGSVSASARGRVGRHPSRHFHDDQRKGKDISLCGDFLKFTRVRRHRNPP